jgi:hypothetical protein
MLETEHVGPAVLDHHGRAGRGGELAQQHQKLPADETASEVSERLALHDADYAAVQLDGVVP